jgi:phage gpG-like protein
MPDTGATIEIQGLDELVKKLDDLKQLRKVHAGIRAAGMYVKGRLAKYPRRKRVKISEIGGWASEKQRRWFFWALKEGKIEVPYRRGISPGSEDLASKWTSKYDKNKFEAVVGNNASYARFVMGDKQTKMMKRIGWKTVETVSKEETKRVQEYVFDAVMRAIKV